MNRAYKKKSAANSIVSDTAYIGSRLSWWGALSFGFISFMILYFVFPAWLDAKLAAQATSPHYPMLDALIGRRIHWFKWVGLACGLIGLYYGVRNFYLNGRSGYQERNIVSMLAKFFSRRID